MVRSSRGGPDLRALGHEGWRRGAGGRLGPEVQRRPRQREAPEGVRRRPIDAEEVRPGLEDLVDARPARQLRGAVAAPVPRDQHVPTLLRSERRAQPAPVRDVDAVDDIGRAGPAAGPRELVARREGVPRHRPRCASERHRVAAPVTDGTPALHTPRLERQRVAPGRLPLPRVGEDGVPARIEDLRDRRLVARDPRLPAGGLAERVVACPTHVQDGRNVVGAFDEAHPRARPGSNRHGTSAPSAPPPQLASASFALPSVDADTVAPGTSVFAPWHASPSATTSDVDTVSL